METNLEVRTNLIIYDTKSVYYFNKLFYNQ